MALASGDQIGNYKVLSLIGRGGMGEVYRALDTELDREVAIKVLPAALANDPERLARFEREAKVLAQLNHPGIAAIYGVEGRSLITRSAVPAHLPLTRCSRFSARSSSVLMTACRLTFSFAARSSKRRSMP
jgi:serine/threonine protein kinase